MKTKKLVLIALFAAITCIATLAVRVPSGISGGYVNMGDAVVLLSAYLLGPVSGAVAAAVGSFFADIIAGYAVFAVPTLIIKFLVALFAGLVFSKFRKQSFWVLVVCGIIGEFFMVSGYFVTEMFLSSSFAAAVAGIYGNLTQAVFGIVVSSVLFKLLAPNVAIKKYLN